MKNNNEESNLQWPPKKQYKKRLVPSGIKNTFLSGSIIINPEFLNTENSHCIIYFNENQKPFFNRVKRENITAIFVVSERHFIIFEDTIPEDYLEASQVKEIQEAFIACNTSGLVKELYKNELEKIELDFQEELMRLLDKKLITNKKNTLHESSEYIKYLKRVISIYGNVIHHQQLNRLIHPLSTTTALNLLLRASSDKLKSTPLTMANEISLQTGSSNKRKNSNKDAPKAKKPRKNSVPPSFKKTLRKVAEESSATAATIGNRSMESMCGTISVFKFDEEQYPKESADKDSDQNFIIIESSFKF